MRRKPSVPVIKPYVMNQVALLPPSYDELIAAKRLVRVVNEAVEKIGVGVLLEQYKQQEKTLRGRSSDAKTDPDASCMRMKEDRGAEKPWPKPAYNVQTGTENQFVVGFSVHGRGLPKLSF